MKKLLLVTGIFMSIGLMASAQEKKSFTAAPAPTRDVPNNKTMSETKKEKTARKMQAEKNKNAAETKRASNKPVVKEPISNQ